jgi:hypothetical protein
MLITRKHFLIVFHFCLLMLQTVSYTWAQPKYSKADVREMFPSNTKNLWINYLSGKIDDTHTIDMIIGTDGHTCKGLYTLRSSNITFFFDGEDANNQLKLAEMNKDLKFTGYLNGKYDGTTFEGQWMNTRKNVRYPIKLGFVNSFDNYIPDHRVVGQWNRIYSGTITEKPIKIQIIKFDSLYTVIYTDEHQLRKKETYIGKELQVEMLKMGFSGSTLSNKWIMIDTARTENIDVIYPDDNGYEVVSSLKMTDALEYSTFEYADYYSKLICTRPITGNKRFDTWMSNVFKVWLDTSVKKLKDISTDEIGTKDRWIQVANGWVEVDLYVGDLISGTMYMQSSWQNETEKIPFIYDLRAGKEMTLQDIFDNKFDSKEYFKVVIPDIVKSTTWHKDVKNWVTKQTFDYVCLKEDGISFSTRFNTLYGEKEIVIPYQNVKQNLKPRYYFR